MTTLVKWIIVLFALLLSHLISAQQIEGTWNGTLAVSGVELPIIFKVTKNGETYNATLKSPKQSNQKIPCDMVTYQEGVFTAEVKAIRVTYKGTLTGDEIKGVFNQGGNELPLNLKQGDVLISGRPQDPVKPYPYHSIEVAFENKGANIKLSGTLTVPKNVTNPPVAILISGSGPQNRDEEIKSFNHRPFLVLSDYLTRNGIAVLRYDDRGVAKSEGEFKGATSADFATDVDAAIAFLKTRNDVDSSKIGLIGHSEGGFIAPMVAADNADVAFVVLLSGTGAAGKEVLLSQIDMGAKLEGVSEENIAINNKFTEIVLAAVFEEQDVTIMNDRIDKEIKTYYDALDLEVKKQFTLDEIKKSLSQFVNDPWMHYFIKTDPAQFLSKVKVPILALNGSKDFQVIPKVNLTRIKKILEKTKNKDVTVMELEGLNHLFQTAETGAASEYPKIEETFNESAMKVVSDWVNQRF